MGRARADFAPKLAGCFFKDSDRLAVEWRMPGNSVNTRPANADASRMKRITRASKTEEAKPIGSGKSAGAAANIDIFAHQASSNPAAAPRIESKAPWTRR